ncbi:hypothetical protein ACLOAU_08115 [Niabella sp. CJ426]|uniref:hypothetical protein n=1 Tax=Niabella sp. CJ426 TaxID=3393740 RepID=UPI003D043E99
MKQLLLILSLALLSFYTWANDRNVSFNFYGDKISFTFNDQQFVEFNEKSFTDASIQQFYNEASKEDYSSIFTMLANYRQTQKADDWLFYQLVRKTAEQISPKAENYLRYTLYKWYFMVHSGYGTMLSQNNGRLLFYIQCDENIYNIPYRIKDGKQYVCLNYHDYGSNINFDKEPFKPVEIILPAFNKTFSYKIDRLPTFNDTDYIDKELQFTYNSSDYNFKIKINPQIKNLFNNYPAVEYKDFINIPLSNATYQSLITLLKKQLKGLNVKSGVDYLMHFTRYAFAFDADTKVYGDEKRLSPEQTLLSPYSDCEDRVGLFFFLVKEIYNLPMIVLAYPKHVTIAVKFDKPIGNTIEYNGAKYSVCEPTPQRMELEIGQLLPELKKEHFEVAYAYMPDK